MTTLQVGNQCSDPCVFPSTKDGFGLLAPQVPIQLGGQKLCNVCMNEELIHSAFSIDMF